MKRASQGHHKLSRKMGNRRIIFVRKVLPGYNKTESAKSRLGSPLLNVRRLVSIKSCPQDCEDDGQTMKAPTSRDDHICSLMVRGFCWDICLSPISASPTEFANLYAPCAIGCSPFRGISVGMQKPSNAIWKREKS